MSTLDPSQTNIIQVVTMLSFRSGYSLVKIIHSVKEGCNSNKRSLSLFTPPRYLLSADDRRNCFHTLTRQPIDDDVRFSRLASKANGLLTTRQPFHPFQPQQVRWKRKGGASAFSKPRPPTRKQRQAYSRWKKKLYWEKVGRHGEPGSKAGARREWEKQEHDDLMMYGTPERQALIDKYAAKASDYDYHDALLEDLMGNTKDYTSLPTPEPIYYGHKQQKYFEKVKKAMDAYLLYKEQQRLQIESGVSDKVSHDSGKQGENNSQIVELSHDERLLPTDRDISLALKAYRDKYGTKHKPIGIAKALQHLLKDLKLPTSLFGEGTYTALLTCCRTPGEAQRIFKMQRDAQHPISAYSWSILVDVHAKLGDYEGCEQAIKDMAAAGVTPTMAAYTSLMAACYKVCSDGRIPQKVRIQAYNVGWSKWKEMRIIGLDPDVMAYGAMLRLCALKGHPEKALNLLEEMPMMDVKPTTLCFTSALRAVARSQEMSTRYERGWSKVNKKREQITLHHGKMARKIVILAENAEVELDDGFVSALMLCAAAAGDSATAKAILLASDVRKMDHLRTIGSNAHLMRLRGEKVPFDNYDREPVLVSGKINADNADQRKRIRMGQDSSNDGFRDEMIESGHVNSPPLKSVHKAVRSNSTSSALGDPNYKRPISVQLQDIPILTTPSFRQEPYPSYGEREYGKDTRKLNALMRACSRALDSHNGLGTMWGGHDNKGFLCENSLRLINERRKPEYVDDTIPDVHPFDLAVSALNIEKITEGIDELPARERRARLNNLDFDPNVAFDMFDLDDTTFKSFTGVDIKKQIEEGEEFERELEERRRRRRERVKDTPPNSSTPQLTAGTVIQEADELYFDQDEMKWKTKPRDKNSASYDRVPKNLGTASALPADAANDNDVFSARFDAKTGKIEYNSKPPLDTSTAEAELLHNDSDDDPDLELYVDPVDMQLKYRPAKPEQKTAASSEHSDEEMYFDNNEMRWMTRPKGSTPLIPVIEGHRTDKQDGAIINGDELHFENDERQWKTKEITEKQEGSLDVGEELYFDNYDMQWKPKPTQMPLSFAKVETTQKTFEEKFPEKADKISKRKEESKDLGARALLEHLNQENSAEGSSRGSGFFLRSQIEKSEHDDHSLNLDGDELDQFFESLKLNENKRKVRGGFVPDLERKHIDSFRSETSLSPQMQVQTQPNSNIEQKSAAFLEDFEELASHVGLLPRKAPGTESGISERSEDSLSEKNAKDVYVKQPKHVIQALRMALPGLPTSRLHQIWQTFQGSLGDPPLLKLIPILRENMPEYITSGWLTKKNLQNAYFAFEKARDDGLVDVNLLNGILEVESHAGRLDRTLQVYEEEFHRYKVVPTEYSDRIVVQMLVRNNRLARALDFKGRLERAGRTLDIQSYGTLIEYYGRKEQLGSALLLLRECLAVHGAPPGEASLTRIRTICRREDLEKQVGLKEMIGEDPIEWLRHGEANLKREYSKKGNRNVNYPNNKLLHI